MAGVTDLAKDFAQKFSVSQTQGKAAVQFVLDSIAVRLAAGEDVAGRGFGTFKTKPLGERTIKNPRTGEPTLLAPSTRVLFTPGAALKLLVNGKSVEAADSAEVIQE